MFLPALLPLVGLISLSSAAQPVNITDGKEAVPLFATANPADTVTAQEGSIQQVKRNA